MRTSITVGLAMVVLASTLSATHADDLRVPPAAVGDFRELLEQFRERSGVPGATIGFVLPDGTSGSVSVGEAFTETGAPMRGHHRMMSGSTGKTLFAAVTLQLVAEGVLDLDTKISNWLGEEPWFERLPNAGDITLRMLLNHTSGIPRYVTLPAFAEAMVEDPDRHWRPAELLEFVLDADPRFVAGEGWSYADTNFVVVGVIVERVTGESCYSHIHRRVLRTHALHDLVPTTSRDVLGLAGGYVDTRRNLLRLEEANVVQGGRYVFNPQFEWAGGGFASTPRDLARWARLLYAGDVLDDDMRRAMRTTVEAHLGPGSRYGLGMMQRPSDVGDVLGHAGYFPGYLTDMAYYVELDLALAIQVNTTRMSPEHNPRALQTLLDECAGVVRGE